MNEEARRAGLAARATRLFLYISTSFPVHTYQAYPQVSQTYRGAYQRDISMYPVGLVSDFAGDGYADTT